jgi:hypothetical protein
LGRTNNYKAAEEALKRVAFNALAIAYSSGKVYKAAREIYYYKY